jgi:hypothetical protein
MMRRLLITCALACLAGALLFGFTLQAPASPRVIPTPTADPLIWPGCKTCDVQRSKMQTAP